MRLAKVSSLAVAGLALLASLKCNGPVPPREMQMPREMVKARAMAVVSGRSSGGNGTSGGGALDGNPLPNPECRESEFGDLRRGGAGQDPARASKKDILSDPEAAKSCREEGDRVFYEYTRMPLQAGQTTLDRGNWAAKMAEETETQCMDMLGGL